MATKSLWEGLPKDKRCDYRFADKKDEIVSENLEYTKDVGRMQVVKKDNWRQHKQLAEFGDALFEAMVDKVIIRSMTEFEFVFESGQKVKVKASI